MRTIYVRFSMRAPALCLLLLVTATAPFCSAAAADRVRLQLKWIHQAQFAGFYVAIEKGFYADQGFEVELIAGGSEIDVTRSLTSGRADFAVVAPEDVIIKRSQGAMLTAIAAIYRRSAVVFLSKADSGITGPRDLLGKTIAAGGRQGSVRDFEFQLAAMMKNIGLDFSKVKVIAYDPGYGGFYGGKVDVTGSYLTGGLIKIRRKGCKPNIIWPGDYRVRFYSDTLATTDRMIADRPERVDRFLRATLKGWEAAIGDPADTVDIVMKYAEIKDRALQTDMFEAMVPLVHTGENRIGWMTAGAWREMHRVMVDQQLIKKPIDPVADLYDLRFLDRIQKVGD